MESAKLDAEARERLGQAEANVTTMVSKAAKDGGSKALNYFIAQKYVEAFSTLAKAPNQKVVLMPMETSGLIGTLGGLAEIAKDTFQDKKK